MNRALPILVGFLLAFAAGYLVAWMRHGDSNPGHADSTLYFAVAAAHEQAGREPSEALLRRLLAIDNRYAPAPIKAAFYSYVAAVAEAVTAKKEGRPTSGQRSVEAAMEAFQRVAPE
ncbi:MAG: hypothetical protein Q7S40_31400 [Opitutaceae bacterium]|nr:hypothetical protein [Opitutaceae bacterium]